jgi:hypothetical protein
MSRRRWVGAEIAPFVSSVSTPLKNTSVTGACGSSVWVQCTMPAIVYQSGRLINLRPVWWWNRLAEAMQGRRRNSDAISFSDTLVVSERGGESGEIAIFTASRRRFEASAATRLSC